MLMVYLISFNLGAFVTDVKALTTLAVVSVVHVTLNTTDIANDFPLVQLFFLLSDSLDILEIVP